MRVRRIVGAAALALTVSIPAFGGVADAAPAAPAVLGGQFCKGSDVGRVTTADNGVVVKCMRVDGYNRWVVK